MTTDAWRTATPIPTTELPAVITAYLAAHHAHDVEAELACLSDTATITDEGNTYTGPAEIRAWSQRATSEYQYTIELTGALRLDDSHYVALHHLEGDFPGGVVDLNYRFTLVGNDKIADLVIEP